MLDYDAAGDATTREDILALLREPAEAGIGAAIQLIASLDTDAAHRQTIYEQYAGVIADNGDFDALVGLRAGYRADLRAHTDLDLTFGVRNLFDVDYVDNVRPNAFGGRVFEPGPPLSVYGQLTLRTGSATH